MKKAFTAAAIAAAAGAILYFAQKYLAEALSPQQAGAGLTAEPARPAEPALEKAAAGPAAEIPGPAVQEAAPALSPRPAAVMAGTKPAVKAAPLNAPVRLALDDRKAEGQLRDIVKDGRARQDALSKDPKVNASVKKVISKAEDAFGDLEGEIAGDATK